MAASFGGLALWSLYSKKPHDRALKWGTNIEPSLSGLGCTDQNVNQENWTKQLLAGNSKKFLGLWKCHNATWNV